MLITPAQPPFPTIWNRSFQFVGSLTTKLFSGQITPRMSQCSGIWGVAAISFAESILTSGPSGADARSSHFLTGAARAHTEDRRNAKTAFLIVVMDFLFIL